MLAYLAMELMMTSELFIKTDHCEVKKVNVINNICTKIHVFFKIYNLDKYNNQELLRMKSVLYLLAN